MSSRGSPKVEGETEEESQRGRDYGKMVTEMQWCLPAQRGGRGPEPKNVGDPQKLEKARKPSPPDPPAGTQPCYAWILAKRDSLQTSDRQNCKIINGCCFKPLS